MATWTRLATALGRDRYSHRVSPCPWGLNEAQEGVHMFRRRNWRMLAAAITAAALAAMAGPVGRASASTAVPVDISGDISWTFDSTPQPPGETFTGAQKQTGTVHVGLTNVTGASATGIDD